MTAQRRAIIAASLEQVAARLGDPAALVYARLFAREPGLAPLFCNDKSGAVRGEMLARAFDTILDIDGDNGYAPHLLRAEQENHAGYGVEPAVFLTFFTVIFEVLETEMRGIWPAESAQAWNALLSEMTAIVEGRDAANPCPPAATA